VVWDELSRDAAEQDQRARDKLIGVYIGILAVILAICSMGGDNASKDATRSNIEASNTWAFFQAKNMRRQLLRIEVDEIELKLATDDTLSEGDKGLYAAKLAEYKKLIDTLTSDDKGEGLDQLFDKGKALESARDLAMQQDPYFDYGSALLQIAIVLASIAIISGGSTLLGVSGLLGAAGILMTINGFTLAVPIPFVG
jgi:hypothetical protein